MGNTQIEWADKGWSPVLGCSRVSSGCRNCYAIRHVHRMASNPNEKIQDAHRGLTGHVRTDGSLDWTGDVRTLDSRLREPLKWTRPAIVFVCPMSDLFHANVPRDYIHKVLDTAVLATRHQFLFLTKRPTRMAQVVMEYRRLLGETERREWDANPRLWFGVSAEDQSTANRRVPILMGAEVPHRWVSAEPLIGPLDLSEWLYPGGVEWVVAGCESGKDARLDSPEWYWNLIDQCSPEVPTFPRTPLFIKQASNWPSKKPLKRPILSSYPYDADGLREPRIGARVWDQYPHEFAGKVGTSDVDRR